MQQQEQLLNFLFDRIDLNSGMEREKNTQKKKKTNENKREKERKMDVVYAKCFSIQSG